MSYTSIYVLPEDKMTIERIDEIIEAYAKKAHEIYVNRTAGDYTWTGFLAAFLTDVDVFRGSDLIKIDYNEHAFLRERQPWEQERPADEAESERRDGTEG